MELDFGQKVYTTETEKIVVLEDRQRKVFNKEKMVQLVEAMKEVGQLSPGLCRMDGDKVTLIFGERRLRACVMLGIPFKYILKEETHPYTLARIEFLENVAREDLDYRDEAKAIEKFHRMSQELFGDSCAGPHSEGHSIRDTAKVADMSPTKVHEELELAKFLEVPEVANAKDRTTARKVIKRLKEEYHTEKALEEARARVNGCEPPSDQSGDDTTENAGSKSSADIVADKLSFFDPLVLCGTLEERLAEFPDGHFNVVCFDPPWGVDFDSVKKENPGQQCYDDSEEYVFANIQKWLNLIYAKMSENSHLYMFFGITRYDRIYSLVESIGFQTNKMPLIWHKQGAHVTRNPDVWPGRAYEPIVYARKGNKNLCRKGAPDVIMTQAPWPSLKSIHPSAKHPDVYLELLKRSCMPGDKILDPMCGSGMFGVAAEIMRVTHQLDWRMIEKEQAFVNLALKNLITGYSGLTKREDMERKGE
jgi:ParB/RepB/Spo0J family partition protein